MAKLHICNLVEVRHWLVPDSSEPDQGVWQTQNRWQNGNTLEPIDYDGHKWGFLSFMYQGATRTRTGDNIEAGLVVSTNQISLDYSYDIVVMDWNVHQHHIKRQVIVRTCLLNTEFTQVQKVLTTEKWIGASMNYDAEMVEITLSAAIDAVFSGFPNQYLDETVVGRLPTTARVSTS